MGEEWNFVTNYVFDFEWGASKKATIEGIAIPDERIFMTRDPSNTGH